MVDTAAELAGRLGIDAVGASLLRQACVHPSYASEQAVDSNQRLEFLGDAVLDLVVAEALYLSHPELDEGGMSKARIALVNEAVLAELASSIGLGELLSLGKGAEASDDRKRPSVLSDALEAVFGAIYLAQGYEQARRSILALLGGRIDEAASAPGATDFKTLVHEWAQAERGAAPTYRVASSGPDHEPTFVAELLLGDEVIGRGSGRSKKLAEQDAARAAWGEVAGA